MAEPILASMPMPRPVAPPIRWALVGLSLSMVLSSLGTSVANVALPTLEEAFGASFGEVQWVVLAYLLAVTTLVVSAGRLGDLVGRRRLLVGGIATFTLASALCAAAPALWVLIGARALQGLGAALMMALTLAFVADTMPRARTGSAMGLLGSMSAIGTALGPSLGGVLVAGLGWRAIFLLNVPPGLLALRLAHRHLPAGRPRRGAARPPFDLAGTLLLALTLGAYALAMTIGNGRIGPLEAALLVAAIGTAALLVIAERRAEAPLISAGMLRDAGLGAALATSGLVSTVMMATLVVGPFYLARGLGLGPALVGLVMSVGPAVVALSGVPAGRLTDRLGARRLTLAGLAVMAGGAGLLSVAPSRLGVPGYLGPIVVLTLGYALFQTANTTAALSDAPPEHRGVVSGMLTLSRNLGLVTGASVMGAAFILAAGGTNVASAPAGAVATGMRVTFAVAATLLVGALAVAAAAGRRARSRSPGTPEPSRS
jgi:EmrB/QacA subfamily drug resistance transporter